MGVTDHENGELTLIENDTAIVGYSSVGYPGRVASAKGGYGMYDVSDASAELDGKTIRPCLCCTNNLNMYGIGRMSLLVTVSYPVSGEVSLMVADYVKSHSIGVPEV